MTEYIRPKYCKEQFRTVSMSTYYKYKSAQQSGVPFIPIDDTTLTPPHTSQELLPHPLGCKYLYMNRFVKMLGPSTSPSHTNLIEHFTYPPAVAPDAICQQACVKFPHGGLPLPWCEIEYPSGGKITTSSYDSEKCSCGYHAAYCPRCVDYFMSRDNGEPCSKILVAPIGTTYWHSNAWRAQSYRTLAAFLTIDKHSPLEGPLGNWSKEFPTFYVTSDTINQKIIEVAKEIVLEHDLREETT